MEPNLEADEVLPARMLDQARAVAQRNNQFPIPLRALLAAKGPSRKSFRLEDQWTRFRPGFPLTPTGSGPSRRDPRPAAAVLGSALAPFQKELAMASIRTRWEELVGVDIAAHCQVEKVDKTVLIIRANSTAWATQLRKLSYLMLQKVQAETGSELIDDIKILGPIVPSWKMGALSVPGRGPRDTYG